LYVFLSLVVNSTINWQSGDWALDCDFDNHDFANSEVSSEDCGDKCMNEPGCTHFTWTDYNGGTCWMKAGSVCKADAIEVDNENYVCGIIADSPDSSEYYNVLTTCHQAYEVGACSLPQQDYAIVHPVALGNIDSLGEIKYSGFLCGHILRVDCGHGALDIIITNSNLGGGLDLYNSSWNIATNSASPGEEYCSVFLTNNNPFNADYPICYFSSGETNNEYWRNVALFNTGGQIVKSALLNGIWGTNDGNDPYFAFGGQSTDSELITFYFEDGSYYSVSVGKCQSGAQKQYWS